jgi:hypothetical protein
MGTTERMALPYPEPTDPVANGANDIRALAEAIEAVPGACLWTSTLYVPHTDDSMNGQIDYAYGDYVLVARPTLAVVQVASIYMRPDRAHALSASVWTAAALEPGGSAGRTIDTTPVVNSAGALYTPIGTLNGSWLLPANTAMSWYVRLTGVQGGPTPFAYSYSITMSRYAA